MWFVCAFALIYDIEFFQGAELWTPVLLASHQNQIDVLELLVQHGAQLDVRNQVTLIILLLRTYPLLCTYEFADSSLDCVI